MAKKTKKSAKIVKRNKRARQPIESTAKKAKQIRSDLADILATCPPQEDVACQCPACKKTVNFFGGEVEDDKDSDVYYPTVTGHSITVNHKFEIPVDEIEQEVKLAEVEKEIEKILKPTLWERFKSWLNQFVIYETYPKIDPEDMDRW